MIKSNSFCFFLKNQTNINVTGALSYNLFCLFSINFVKYNKALPWQSGKPTYPNMQLSHLLPENISLHEHWPLSLSHRSVFEPVISQAHANEKNQNYL